MQIHLQGKSTFFQPWIFFISDGMVKYLNFPVLFTGHIPNNPESMY